MKFSYNQAVYYKTTKIQPSLTPVELLFRNDKLDKDVQRIVQPFNIMLSVFFSSKYKTRNNYMTPCDKKYLILLFFSVSLCNLFSVYRTHADSKYTHKFSAVNLIGLTFY